MARKQDAADVARRLTTAFDTLYAKVRGYEGTWPTREARDARKDFEAAIRVLVADAGADAGTARERETTTGPA